MRPSSSPFVLGLCLLLLLGCDRNGYPDIGEKLDVVVPCGPNSTTWVRSTCGTHPNGEEGHLITEVLILGTDDLSPTAAPSGCYVHSELFYDSSARQWNGSFEAAGGVAQARSGFYYEFELQTDIPVLSRTGAFRRELSPPLFEEFTYSSDGTTLTVTDTTTGEERIFRNVIDILSTLDPSVQADAFTFSRVFGIPIYNSLNRLLGFGSGGMTQYMSQTGVFQGLISGEYRVVVEGLLMPKTTLTYIAFQEFTGFVFDGEYVTIVDPGGDGYSRDTLDFDFQNSLSDPTSHVTGTMDFTDVIVQNGFGWGGCYTLYYESNPPMIIPSEIYNSIDLTDVLPTDGTPAPGSGSACPMYDPWLGPYPTECPLP